MSGESEVEAISEDRASNMNAEGRSLLCAQREKTRGVRRSLLPTLVTVSLAHKVSVISDVFFIQLFPSL